MNPSSSVLSISCLAPSSAGDVPVSAVRTTYKTVLPRWRRVALLGSIPAGYADQRTQQVEGMIHVDMETLRLPHGVRIFALRVSGDSMVGRSILEGDVVILEQGAEPRNGEVVAALIDGQSTLKTFVLRGGRPFLKAENPRYPDLIPAAELVIQGVMRSLLRNTPRRP